MSADVNNEQGDVVLRSPRNLCEREREGLARLPGAVICKNPFRATTPAPQRTKETIQRM